MSRKSSIRMQEKFGDDFDAKVVSWTEQTRETELMIRLLEEIKKHSFQEGSASHGAPFLIELFLTSTSAYTISAKLWFTRLVAKELVR